MGGGGCEASSVDCGAGHLCKFKSQRGYDFGSLIDWVVIDETRTFDYDRKFFFRIGSRDDRNFRLSFAP